MHRKLLPCALLGLLALAASGGCSSEEEKPFDPSPLFVGDAAFATDTPATKSAQYYAEQGSLYFDTLDSDIMDPGEPHYAEHVARWEWPPPWLKLTGWGKSTVAGGDGVVKTVIHSTIPKEQRDCRGFDKNPFARCYVNFVFKDGDCGIYEEFSFNEAGEITFIEAWSDLPGKLPMPDPKDRWAEGPNIHRMSTKLPGLGSKTGVILLDGEAMEYQAKHDPEVADLRRRGRDYWGTWAEELLAAKGRAYALGCGWKTEADYPPDEE